MKETKLDRRSFLKGTAAAASAVAASGAISAMADEAAPAVLNHDSVDGKWSFEIPPEAIGDDQIAETREAEIIVVGAGTAGLVCAVAAAEAGGKVILFAKGAGPIGRGGSNFAFHSKYRESLGLEPIKFRPFYKTQMLTNSLNIDQAKWMLWYKTSEDYMNWLIDIMAEPGNYELYLEQVQHLNRCDDPELWEWNPLATHGWIDPEIALGVGDGQPFVVSQLAKKAQSLGVEIYYDTCAKQLVRGGVPNGTEGRVDAVIAQDANGNYIKFVGTKAIVLATGDFSRDRDMMKRYAPEWYDVVKNFDVDEDFDPEAGKVYGGLYEGDGQKMGLWVGAAWQKNFPCPAMVGGGYGGVDTITAMINVQTGKRFHCEGETGGFYSYIYKNHVYGNKIAEIWDSAYAENAQPWPKRKTGYTTPLYEPEEIIAQWDAKVEDGTYVKADTIEEVIEKLGLQPEIIDEINRYNGFCETGVDEDFLKLPEFLIPIKTPPFYGFVGEPSYNILTVMGGLRTNDNMQVCDAADEPIPGLYNVGTMIGDVYYGCYQFKIPGQNLGMNCGALAKYTGEFIVANE